ncbi:MAG: PQQ-dependent sugar dehydrogenase [Phycisphaerales bacterium]|nr:PQQ-dependent sugar dehydrogenase [Phycisphaerales bacterium]
MNRFACACLVGALSTVANAQLTTQQVASGIDRPVFMTHAGDGSGRLFIIEQEGQIRVLQSDGTLLAAPFMDIDSIVVGGNSGGDERGLLGLAFHPDYANNGKFYVDYTGAGGHTQLAEYTLADPSVNVMTATDLGTRRQIMQIIQPFSNHNGGWIGFGPDGYLYVVSGDGGAANDPGDRAGDLLERLGKLHRIDVSGADDFPGDSKHNYAIPADNPFVGDGGGVHESIWNYGLRNPWRTSFDSMTGDLWIADVGQFSWEEVNFEAAGGSGGHHYGWRCREGFNPAVADCAGSDEPFYEPIHEYGHGPDCSVTGGYVYRGCELGEAYQGKYFFSDYCGGRIWTLDPTNGYARTTEFNTGFNVSSFGQDEDGEIYIADLFAGRVFKIIDPNAPDDNDNGIIDTCESLGCNSADLAEPLGTLNLQDVFAYLALFNAQDPAADLANPIGILNLQDVFAYLAVFNNGCP